MIGALSLYPEGALAQEARLRDLYSRAQAAQQAGDFRAAASHYEELVGLMPDLAEAHANLGSIYYQMREDAKAQAALEKALELKPNIGAAPHFFLGVIAARHQKHEQSIRRLVVAREIDPTNLVVAYYLGEAYFAEGRYGAAIGPFQEATALADFRADAYYYLSKAYGSLSKQAMARLGKEHPRSHYIQLARGHFEEGRKNWQSAEHAYRAALEIEPGTPGVEERRQWVGQRASSERPAGAPPPLPDGEATMLSMLYRPPDDQAIDTLFREYANRLQRAQVPGGTEREMYRLAEDYQIASYLAARWIGKNDPGSYRARQLRAQLHEARGEVDDAVREYHAALRLKPDLQNVHFAVGTMLWSVSRLEEAKREVESELRINPNHAEAHYVLADILQVEGRESGAKTHLLEALRLNPDLFEAHLAIERIYFSEGQFEKALEELEIAARLSPDDPTPRYRMSMVHRRLGNDEAALRELEAFQRLQQP
jgi:tetratricopeptide (TPR) repeat protein